MEGQWYLYNSKYYYRFDPKTDLILKQKGTWKPKGSEKAIPRFILGSAVRDLARKFLRKARPPWAHLIPVDGAFRCRSDDTVRFGDGGVSHLSFPLFKKSDVLTEEQRISFLRGLLWRAHIMQDRQGPNSVVEDIIDPNLFPRRIVNPDWKTRTYNELLADWQKAHPDTVYLYNRADDGGYYDSVETPGSFEIRFRNCQPKLPPGFLLREGYSWIPTDFLINSEGKVTIDGYINMVPLAEETEQIYEGFTQVFESMIPSFKAIGVITSLPCKLQVVCKAQRYVLEPYQTYDGFWHREGQNERIVGVGVYYVDIAPEIVGGSLKFRYAFDPPDPNYSEYCDIKPEESVAAETNSFVVFGNELPHRVRLMENQSDQVKERVFINFFVVDPDHPLPSTNTQITSKDLLFILQCFSLRHLQQFLPKEILQLILHECDLWTSVEEAKEYRQKAREAMLNTRSQGPGWAHCHYGNCGVQKFANHLEELTGSWKDECSKLYHSHSTEVKPETEALSNESSESD